MASPARALTTQFTPKELQIALDAVTEQTTRAPKGVGCGYVDERAQLAKKLRSLVIAAKAGQQ